MFSLFITAFLKKNPRDCEKAIGWGITDKAVLGVVGNILCP